jgi:transposase
VYATGLYLRGILFVLRSGIPWRMMPKELGGGSGMTCWRRLHDWQHAGIWDLIHFVLLNWLSRDGQIDWSRRCGPEEGFPATVPVVRAGTRGYEN